jgi:putative transposase
VRAGIAKRAEDWKWSSARAHVTGESDSAIELFDWLEPSERSNYSDFLDEEGNDDSIRKATSTGRPIGSEDFVGVLEKQLGRAIQPKRRGRPSKAK